MALTSLEEIPKETCKTKEHVEREEWGEYESPVWIPNEEEQKWLDKCKAKEDQCEEESDDGDLQNWVLRSQEARARRKTTTNPKKKKKKEEERGNNWRRRERERRGLGRRQEREV